MRQAPNCLLFGHDLLALNSRHVVEPVSMPNCPKVWKSYSSHAQLVQHNKGFPYTSSDVIGF